MLWLLVGLIVGIGAYWLVSRLRARNVNVTWYEWALVVIAVILALLAIQNFEASIAELETQAAWILLALFGVPAVVAAAVAWLLVQRHNLKASAPVKS
ncbi:MAG TPA: dehalogenase [Anaerolineae bacterium]